MLGTGAPDGETIAAHLQTGLEKTHSQPVCVVNFGQSGWVSTQSLIQLVGELQAGRVPDAVLFYDGLNEVLAIHESEQPGAHVSLSRTASLFEQSIPPLWTFVRSSRTYGLISRRSAGRRERCEMQTPDAEERASNLAQRATDVYLGNYRLVESLASAFDFDFSFFLQPHPATSGKVLTREEVKIMAESDPALSQVAVRFYEDVGRLSPTRPRLWSLARVLDRETETIWIDATGHMTPGGNRIVASAMLDVLNQGSGG